MREQLCIPTEATFSNFLKSVEPTDLTFDIFVDLFPSNHLLHSGH